MMTNQEKKLAKKRGRPATGRSKTIGVRIPNDMLKGLDAAIAASDAQPGRPKMIRRIVAEWLVKRGFLEDGEKPSKSRARAS